MQAQHTEKKQIERCAMRLYWLNPDQISTSICSGIKSHTPEKTEKARSVSIWMATTVNQIACVPEPICMTEILRWRGLPRSFSRQVIGKSWLRDGENRRVSRELNHCSFITLKNDFSVSRTPTSLPNNRLLAICNGSRS